VTSSGNLGDVKRQIMAKSIQLADGVKEIRRLTDAAHEAFDARLAGCLGRSLKDKSRYR
jgi:hypothetical protein